MSDPAIFRALAAFWEDKFFKDMDRLRVRRPDTLTRVTEYVPEIAEFVKRIMENGYAYEHEGSVYFDTVAFDSSENHTYAKLEPWSKGNRELLAEGEGWPLKIFAMNFINALYPCRCTLDYYWQTFCIRFCFMEGVKVWGALVAVTVGSRSSRLAHRMLGDGKCNIR